MYTPSPDAQTSQPLLLIRVPSLSTTLKRWFTASRLAIIGAIHGGLERLHRADRGALLAATGVLVLVMIGWMSVPRHHAPKQTDSLIQALPSTAAALAPASSKKPAVLKRPTASTAPSVASTQQPAAKTTAVASQEKPTTTPAIATFAFDRLAAERNPSDHMPMDTSVPTRVRVVTIRARVTAYTANDHDLTHPQWADGVVAWHAGGRKRHVSAHPYCLATDWNQFPPGATFIRVPGYMSQTYSTFPESFRVVDDACGAARSARRRGLQPVIDVRFRTLHSAIGSRDAWGSRHLDVEVVFPPDHQIDSSLQPWIVKDEWQVFHHGERVQ